MKDKKLVTFYLNKKIYDKFRKICEEKGLIMSRKVEKLIEEQSDD